MSSGSRRPKGDGSIFRGADGLWKGKLHVEDPVSGLVKRIQVSGRTKAEVSRKLGEMRDRQARGLAARDDAITFGAYARGWLQSSLPASDRKQSTKALYAGLTRCHILDSELSRLPLNRLRPSSVERFITQVRAKGLADSTVRQTYTIARAIGDSAVRDGLLATNPFAAVRRPRVKPHESSFLTSEQIRKLLAAAEDSRYLPLFELLVNTGLRRGEALALRWRDIDLDNGRLQVRGTLARIEGVLSVSEPKSARSRRTIPLSAPAVEALTRIRQRTALERGEAADSWIESGFVFVTDLGEAADPRNALRALTVAGKAAGLKHVGLHTLRHSAASLMLSNGVPITVVSDILGHSGIAITVDVYGHVAPHVSREAVDVLAAALATTDSPRPHAPDE